MIFVLGKWGLAAGGVNGSKSAVKNVFDEGRRVETFLVFRGTTGGRTNGVKPHFVFVRPFQTKGSLASSQEIRRRRD